jgi:hypothetical protein
MQDRVDASTQGPFSVESRIAAVEQRLAKKRGEADKSEEEEKEEEEERPPFVGEEKGGFDKGGSALLDAARKRVEAIKRERVGTP